MRADVSGDGPENACGEHGAPIGQVCLGECGSGGYCLVPGPLPATAPGQHCDEGRQAEGEQEWRNANPERQVIGDVGGPGADDDDRQPVIGLVRKPVFRFDPRGDGEQGRQHQQTETEAKAALMGVEIAEIGAEDAGGDDAEPVAPIDGGNVPGLHGLPILLMYERADVAPEAKAPGTWGLVSHPEGRDSSRQV
jgi:hypothetical protein